MLTSLRELSIHGVTQALCSVFAFTRIVTQCSYVGCHTPWSTGVGRVGCSFRQLLCGILFEDLGRLYSVNYDNDSETLQMSLLRLAYSEAHDFEMLELNNKRLVFSSIGFWIVGQKLPSTNVSYCLLFDVIGVVFCLYYVCRILPEISGGAFCVNSYSTMNMCMDIEILNWRSYPQDQVRVMRHFESAVRFTCRACWTQRAVVFPKSLSMVVKGDILTVLLNTRRWYI